MKMNGMLNKKIPTILGLILLFAALGLGVFYVGSGPGVFAPRATPQTTPKNIRITNLTDTTFTVSFVTDEQTIAFVKYGTSATSLNTQASDDRDQSAGNIGTYTTHHITLRNLQPETTYHFVIGTGTNTLFDDGGQPYSTTTTDRISGAGLAQTIYGMVLDADDVPANGSIVYSGIQGAGELSTTVRSSGRWAIPLSQLRSTDGSEPPDVTANTPLLVAVQGVNANDTASLTTVVGQPQFPIPTIVMGENTVAQATDSGSSGTDQEPVVSASESAVTVTPTSVVTQTIAPTTTATATATRTPTATPIDDDVSLPATDSPKPISGSISETISILALGLMLFAIGSLFFVNLKKE